MFTVNTTNQVTLSVTVNYPQPDGSSQEMKFPALFKKTTRQEYVGLIQESMTKGLDDLDKAQKAEDGPQKRKSAADAIEYSLQVDLLGDKSIDLFMERYFLGIPESFNIVDQDGQEISDTNTRRMVFLADPIFRKGIYDRYASFMKGEDTAKN